MRAWRAHLRSSNRVDWQAFLVSTLGFEIVRTLRLLSAPSAPEAPFHSPNATGAVAAAAAPTPDALAAPQDDSAAMAGHALDPPTTMLDVSELD